MNSLKKIMAASFIGGLLSVLATTAFAVPVLSFNNAGGNIAASHQIGDIISLDLWLSGLDGTDDLGGLDLAVFDLNMLFNSAVTSYQQTVFSSVLDDSMFYGLTALATTADSVNLSGLSLLTSLASQANALKLFTMEFTANQVGLSTIRLDNIMLANSWFTEFSNTSYSADITVTGNQASVPEPSGLGLFAAALALLLIRRRKNALK